MSALGVIILAAGQGTRMKSRLPKVLHPVCGRPMVSHILREARALAPKTIVVVVGHGGDEVRGALAGEGVVFVEQTELVGTADAVGRCREALDGCGQVVVLNGDSPLITRDLLTDLLATGRERSMAFVTCALDDGGRLGRVARDGAGEAVAIVEAADEGPRTGPIEVNAGQYVFDAAWLWSHLPGIPRSPKGEYYLTHLIGVAASEGSPAATVASEPAVVLGVDDRVKLAEAERLMRTRILECHMLAGVTITDPATTYIDAEVAIEPDVTVLPNCHLQGRTGIGEGSVIGPGTTLRDATIGHECRVQNSVIEESRIGERVRVGPFAHIRGNADVGDDCYIGNYAEIKNSVIGPEVAMHHFSYMGDADIGARANIAAGSITCNFDGVNKNRTVIGEDAFIGCDTMLIAPITIGAGAYTASGAVVTKDVPPGERVAGVPARPLPRKQPPGD